MIKQFLNFAVWRMDRLWTLMHLLQKCRRRFSHPEREQKSAGNASGILSAKIREAGGKNVNVIERLLISTVIDSMSNLWKYVNN